MSNENIQVEYDKESNSIVAIGQVDIENFKESSTGKTISMSVGRPLPIQCGKRTLFVNFTIFEYKNKK